MVASKYKLLRFLGPEAPVLGFIWLLYMVALWPLALMNQIKLALLSTPMALGLGITFVVFSVGRSKSWLALSVLCLFASIAGTALGIFLRATHPVTLEMIPLNYDTTLLKIVFYPAIALMVFLAVISPILGRCGCRIVGTSKEYRQHIADMMVFGTSIERNIKQVVTNEEVLLGRDAGSTIDSAELKDAEVIAKLHDSLYFSGEPIYDFAFWLANNHMMLGIIFHHPLSPFETGHRMVVCITTSLLIVFPVALVTVLWPKILGDFPGSGIVRLILMALLVILPRNMLKARMRKIAVEDEEAYLKASVEEDTKSADRKNLKELKKTQTRKEAIIYDGVCVFTVLFCYLTLNVVSTQSNEAALKLLLENTDGLGFCFILEIFFALIMPRPSRNPKVKCMGWFGRWRSERIWMMSS